MSWFPQKKESILFHMFEEPWMGCNLKNTMKCGSCEEKDLVY